MLTKNQTVSDSYNSVIHKLVLTALDRPQTNLAEITELTPFQFCVYRIPVLLIVNVLRMYEKERLRTSR